MKNTEENKLEEFIHDCEKVSDFFEKKLHELEHENTVPRFCLSEFHQEEGLIPTPDLTTQAQDPLFDLEHVVERATPTLDYAAIKQTARLTTEGVLKLLLAEDIGTSGLAA